MWVTGLGSGQLCEESPDLTAEGTKEFPIMSSMAMSGDFEEEEFVEYENGVQVPWGSAANLLHFLYFP